MDAPVGSDVLCEGEPDCRGEPRETGEPEREASRVLTKEGTALTRGGATDRHEARENRPRVARTDSRSVASRVGEDSRVG